MIKRLIVLTIVSLMLQKSFAQSDMLYIQGVNHRASSGETPGMILLKGSGYIKLGFCMDEPSKYTFMIEAKTNRQGVVSILKDTAYNSNPKDRKSVV
jgi:hypothetical protein